MHNFLVISGSFPRPDQASGDLRFFTLLSLVARKDKLLFCASDADGIPLRRNVLAIRGAAPFHRFQKRKN